MTNNFAALSAESSVDSLALIASNEGEDFAPVASAPAPRGVNVAKLVRHNLRQPIARRISRAALEKRVAFAATRGMLVAMHATIRAECDAQIAALRASDEALASL